MLKYKSFLKCILLVLFSRFYAELLFLLGIALRGVVICLVTLHHLAAKKVNPLRVDVFWSSLGPLVGARIGRLRMIDGVPVPPGLIFRRGSKIVCRFFRFRLFYAGDL